MSPRVRLERKQRRANAREEHAVPSRARPCEISRAQRECRRRREHLRPFIVLFLHSRLDQQRRPPRPFRRGTRRSRSPASGTPAARSARSASSRDARIDTSASSSPYRSSAPFSRGGRGIMGARSLPAASMRVTASSWTQIKLSSWVAVRAFQHRVNSSPVRAGEPSLEHHCDAVGVRRGGPQHRWLRERLVMGRWNAPGRLERQVVHPCPAAAFRRRPRARPWGQ